MAATFKGPKFPLNRSRYGERARSAKYGKYSDLRGKEKAKFSRSDAFAKAIKVAKLPDTLK